MCPAANRTQGGANMTSAARDQLERLPNHLIGEALGFKELERALTGRNRSAFSELSLDAGESGLAQANNLKGCCSLCDHTYRGRSSPRKIEIAAPHEGTTIIDAHDHRAARGGIGHMQPRTEWESPAGGSKTMLIERLSRCCPDSG